MINFKLKQIMKTTMNRILAVCLALGAAAAAATAQSTERNWEFATGDSPAMSASGGGQAVLAPGDFASGWIESDAIFGGATGIWDLGRKGTVTLSDSNLLASVSGQSREITVRVTQWVDGGIYADYADVVVPGAVLGTFDGRVTRLGTIGNWVVDETVWIVDAGATVDSVLVTGALNGSLVDAVSVEAAPSIVDPAPTLVVRRLAGEPSRVELSWSSASNDWVVQGREDLSAGDTNAVSWQAIAAPVTVAGERRAIVIDATSGARFFRLSKP